MEGGNALAKILFGRVNPSGKLPVSFPRKLEDCPAHKLGEFPGDEVTVKYNDDIYVGYRYYDTYHVQPLFAFGHGLSYTSFAYSDLKIGSEGGKTVLSFLLKNTGKTAGAEVAQLYVKEEKPALPRPEKELKAFSKVLLLPGEEKRVTMSLDETAFQYYNDKLGKWVVDAGVFDLLIGSSSQDIRVSGQVTR